MRLGEMGLGELGVNRFQITEKCWTFVYINGSFSLTRLLMICSRGNFLLGHSVLYFHMQLNSS